MNFNDALNWRYAVRQFAETKLTEQQLQPLIDSVRLSASSYGMQPYRLLIIESEAVKRDLLPFSYGQNKVVDCSHLLVLVHRTEVNQAEIDDYISDLANSQGIPAENLAGYHNVISGDLLSRSKEQQAQWAREQAHIALGKLLSAAAINQIDSCPMTGFDIEGVNSVLGLNEQGLSAAIFCPVGIRSEHDSAAARPKFRKQYTDVVTTL